MFTVHAVILIKKRHTTLTYSRCLSV